MGSRQVAHDKSEPSNWFLALMIQTEILGGKKDLGKEERVQARRD